MQQEIPKILRFDDLKRLFKISRSTLDRWEKKKENPFPRRINIGENSIGWKETEIQQWLEERAKQKGGNI